MVISIKAHQPLLLELLNDHELLLEVQVRLVLVGLLPEVVAGVLGLSFEGTTTKRANDNTGRTTNGRCRSVRSLKINYSRFRGKGRERGRRRGVGHHAFIRIRGSRRRLRQPRLLDLACIPALAHLIESYFKHSICIYIRLHRPRPRVPTKEGSCECKAAV